MLTQPQQYIADAKGIVRVKAVDEQVEHLKTDLKTYKRLEGVIKQGKATFRAIAANVLDFAVGGVKAIECYATSGECIKISVPDHTKAGNRTNLNADALKAIAMMGYELDDFADLIEKSESYELTGDFVRFMDEFLAANYTARGIEIPEGVKKKINFKLTADGIEKMLEMRRQHRKAMNREYELAKVLLNEGLKDASVS